MGSFFSIQRIQTINEPDLPGFIHVEKRTKFRMRYKRAAQELRAIIRTGDSRGSRELNPVGKSLKDQGNEGGRKEMAGHQPLLDIESPFWIIALE